MYISYLVVKVLALIVLVLLIPVAQGYLDPVVLAGSVVFLQLGMIFIAKNFKPLALFLIFAFPYIYVALPHFSDGSFPLTLAYTMFDNEVYYANVLVVHSLFIAVTALFIPFIKKPFVIKDYLPQKDNLFVFYGLVFLMGCIIVFGRSGTSIFESGGYGSADANVQLAGGLAIFEYFLVLFPLAYVYSGRKKKHLMILIAISLCFCAKGMLFGGRIEAIQAVLQLFILFIDSKTLKLRKVILSMVIPVFAMVFFGFIRSNPNIGFAEILEVIGDNSSLSMYTFFGNHIDVYYSSTRLYAFVEEGILTFGDRLYIFALNILAVVVPYGKLPEAANLAAYRQMEYPAGGGGLASMFFFVFLSYPGVILFASILGVLIRRIISSHQPIVLLYGLMILSTYPRWFAYSPIVFFKMAAYILPVYFIINLVINKRKTKLKALSAE